MEIVPNKALSVSLSQSLSGVRHRDESDSDSASLWPLEGVLSPLSR